MSKREGKAPTQRQLRLGEEIRHALANIFERGDVHDPYLLDTPLTVTEVKIASDLRTATAFVTPLGGGDPRPLLGALKKETPHIRHLIAQRVHVKFVPELVFKPDPTFDEAERIDALLKSPHVAQDLDGGENPPGSQGNTD